MNKNREQEYKMIGLNIAYYRKLHGLTQLQLAELAGISRTHMSNIEAPNMPTSISLTFWKFPPVPFCPSSRKYAVSFHGIPHGSGCLWHILLALGKRHIICSVAVIQFQLICPGIIYRINIICLNRSSIFRFP